MDCPSSVRLANALSFLATTNQQHVLRYLALLEARNYASSTLLVVAGALKSLTRYLPDTRQAALIADLTQTTSQDISDFVCAAQTAGLAPTTINTKLSLLIEFFEFLREEGLITQQPILRRRHRLLAPTTLPKPIHRKASAKAREFEKWCGQNEGDNSAPRMLKNRPAIVPLKTEV